MQIVYALEDAPVGYAKSIFLAGPTPRRNDVKSWRPEALQILRLLGYDGVVFVPEDRPDEHGNTTFHGNYDGQVEWEHKHLHMADVIVFWVPRSLPDMPAFTTNVEWGTWKDSGKAVFGAPAEAEKMTYLIYEANQLNVPYANSLAATLANAIEILGDGAIRWVGERYVPLHVWRTPAFQQWYVSQRRAGNSLEHAKVLWTFRVGTRREHMFAWALHVEVYIAAEQRVKANEFVIGRPDISTIVAYRKAERLEDTQILLVREFRSACNNSGGFVWEVPGGSTFSGELLPEQLAAEEFHEETGLVVAPERFVFHDARQLAATLSAHKAHVFSIELTDEEMVDLWNNRHTPNGVADEGEQTYNEVWALRHIRSQNLVDWSMLGMIMHVLLDTE